MRNGEHIACKCRPNALVTVCLHDTGLTKFSNMTFFLLIADNLCDRTAQYTRTYLQFVVLLQQNDSKFTTSPQ